jgi:hypothetical protein
MIAMFITIHSSFLAHDDPDASLAFNHDLSAPEEDIRHG